MNSTNWKAALTKVFTVGLVAAAIAVAAPSEAEAQVSFGVRIGGPVYVAPPYRGRVYAAPGYGYAAGYAPGYGSGYAADYSGQDYDREAWARHEAREQHEAWEQREAWQHRGHSEEDHHQDWGR